MMKRHPILTLVVLSAIGAAMLAVSWRPQDKGILSSQATGSLQQAVPVNAATAQPQPSQPVTHEKYYFVEFFAGL